jgi:cytochrome c oxidase assembly factor CtaG
MTGPRLPLAFVRLAWLLLGPLLALAQPALALASDGEPSTPQTLWSHWHWAPAVAIGLVLSLGAYLGGRKAFWRQVEGGRSARRWKRLLSRRAACFLAGLLVLGLALLSPLDALSLALFSAHMSQHMLLILAAAPLLVLGDPATSLIWMLPSEIRRRMGRWWNRAGGWRRLWHALSHPICVWILHALAFWAWHVPVLYQAALGDERVHILEHASFVGTALFFWWRIISPRAGLDRGLAVLFLFTTTLQSGLLAVLITFASSSWYPVYQSTAPAWGLSPLEDQQLAGAIMWIPAGLVYGAAAVALFAAWLVEIELRSGPSPARRIERRADPLRASAPLD